MIDPRCLFYPPVKDGSPLFKKLLFRYRLKNCGWLRDVSYPPGAQERWNELEQAWLKAAGPGDAPEGFLHDYFIPMLVTSMILGDLGLARKAREWAQEHGLFPEKDLARWHALNHLLALGEENVRQANHHLNRLFEIADACSDENIRKQALEVLGRHAELFAEAREYTFLETLCRKSLELTEKTYGGEHPEVTARLHRLVEFLCFDWRRPQAIPLLRRILANDEKNLGPDHETTAMALETLARFLHEVGQSTEAVLLRRRALTIYEKCYGGNSDRAAYAMTELGRLLQELNEMPEAEQLLRGALNILEKNDWYQRSNGVSGLSHLGLFLFANKRYAEAEPLLRRAVEVSRKKLRLTDPGLASVLKDLALLLQADQRPAEAEPIAREAVEIHLAETKPGRPYRQSAIDTYRKILADLKLSEAEIIAKLRSLKPKPRTPSN